MLRQWIVTLTPMITRSRRLYGVNENTVTKENGIRNVDFCAQCPTAQLLQIKADSKLLIMLRLNLMVPDPIQDNECD